MTNPITAFLRKKGTLPKQSLAEKRLIRFHKDHTRIGTIERKDKVGRVISRVPIWRYHGWNRGKKDYKKGRS